MEKTVENTYTMALGVIAKAWDRNETCTAAEVALSIADAVKIAIQQRMTVNVWNCEYENQRTTMSWFERKSKVMYRTSTETVEIAFDDNTAYVAMYDHIGRLIGTSIEDAAMIESLMVA